MDVQPGLMQSWELTVDKIINGAARWHAQRQIVWRDSIGEIRTGDYATLKARARCLSQALADEGFGGGSTVATMAMNHWDHLVVWYATMGMGAVCHTVNPRLHEDQIVYILNHGGARLLMADEAFRDQIHRLRPRLTSVEHIVWLDGGEDHPDSLHAFIGQRIGDTVEWGQFGEDAAAGLCYTSGTTGNPKGVQYSHRSNTLLAMNTSMPDAFGLSERDTVMPVVPMFHANSWGLAFSAPLVGAKLVLPGAALDGASLHELIEREGVTFAAGVPTVWQGFSEYLAHEGVRRSSLRRVVIGGSACPEGLLVRLADLGIEVLHAWGMTELSPVGLAATHTHQTISLPEPERRRLDLKQGRPVGIDARIVDDCGAVLPHDGDTAGRLLVRGPAVIARYKGDDLPAVDDEGWFDTGDVATIDQYGFVRITDRAKDIIKSGGEWISSVDIESAMLSHPDVQCAAVTAIPHPKWGERPKLWIELRSGIDALAPSRYIEHLEGKIAKWWTPDEVEIVDSIPLGATGKIDKKALRGKPPAP